MFKNVGLLWIIKNNNNYKFEIVLEDTQCTDKVPWYNATICTKLNGQISKDYLKTGQKGRYDLMCSVDASLSLSLIRLRYPQAGIGKGSISLRPQGYVCYIILPPT